MIMFDTHVWLWFISNLELLSKKANQAVDAALRKERIFISSIIRQIASLLQPPFHRASPWSPKMKKY
jgi:PIN domain nuclease of toxin-antitoxin system